jgi:hypothetical protein
MAVLNGQIQAVKLVRAFCNLGLADCKAIVDLWEKTYGNNYFTDSFSEICKLGSICKMVQNGDWFIEHGQIIMTKQIATSDDVMKLIP